MPTVLENYCGIRRNVEARISQGSPSADAVWWFGELAYRISVLETCQMYCKTAPATTDIALLLGHYQMLNAFVQSITSERLYGPDRGPDTEKERETAKTNLDRVIRDYRKRFSSFNPTTPDAYGQEISRLVNTLLPVWLQYRNTFIPIKMKKEA